MPGNGPPQSPLTTAGLTRQDVQLQRNRRERPPLAGRPLPDQTLAPLVGPRLDERWVHPEQGVPRGMDTTESHLEGTGFLLPYVLAMYDTPVISHVPRGSTPRARHDTEMRSL